MKRGEGVVADVVETVIAGSVSRVVPSKRTVHLVLGETEAVLSLDKSGETATWLLTGWKRNEPDAIGEVGTRSNATQTGPTFSRSSLGAGSMSMEARIMARIQGESASRDPKKQFSMRRPEWGDLTEQEGVKRDVADAARARAQMRASAERQEAAAERFGTGGFSRAARSRMVDVFSTAYDLAGKVEGERLKRVVDAKRWEQENWVTLQAATDARAKVERMLKGLPSAWDTAAGYFKSQRILAGDREGLVNPETPEQAQAKMAAVEAALKRNGTSVEELRAAVKPVQERAWRAVERLEAVGALKPGVFQKLEGNREGYWTFQVADYAEKGIPPGILEQTGTEKGVNNVFDATVLKTMAMERAARKLELERALVEALRPVGGAEQPDNAASGQPRKLRADEMFLRTYQEGKQLLWRAPRDVVEGVRRLDELGHNADLGVFSQANKVMRSLLLTHNVTWAMFRNPVKDMGRNMMAVFESPEGRTQSFTPKQWLRVYREVYGDALAYARGETTPWIRRLVAEGVLDAPQSPDTLMETKHVDPQRQYLERMGVEHAPDEGAWLKQAKRVGSVMYDASGAIPMAQQVVDKVGAVYKGYLDVLQANEIASKMSGYKLLREAGWDVGEAAYQTHTQVGTPNVKTRGLWTPYTNEILLMSNVMIQGLRADLRMATSKATARKYWATRAAVLAIIPAVTQAALQGLMGERAQELMRTIDPYYRENFFCIPYGIRKDRHGNEGLKFFAVPIPDFMRVFNGMFHSVAGAGGGLLRGDTSVRDLVRTAATIAGAAAESIPTATPTVEMGYNTLGLIQGNVPYDFYKRRPIMDDTTAQALWNKPGAATGTLAKYYVGKAGLSNLDFAGVTTGKAGYQPFGRIAVNSEWFTPEERVDFSRTDLARRRLTELKADRAGRTLERREDVERLRRGEAPSGRYKGRDARELRRRANDSWLVHQARALSLEDLEKYFRSLPDPQRRMIAPVLLEKRRNRRR